MLHKFPSLKCQRIQNVLYIFKKKNPWFLWNAENSLMFQVQKIYLIDYIQSSEFGFMLASE